MGITTGITKLILILSGTHFLHQLRPVQLILRKLETLLVTIPHFLKNAAFFNED